MVSMSNYNRVVLVGHLTRDPELNFTANSGKAVCEVGLAVNERYKKDEQWIEEVTFVEITFWGKTAEVLAEYCQQGSPLLVEGKLKLDAWEKDGQKRSKLRVVAQQMRMLGGPQKDAKQSSSADASENQELAGTGAAGGDSQF